MNKTPIKFIRKWLSIILTTLVVVILFGIIFIQLDLIEPSASFFVELGCVLILSLQMKVYWYSYGENKRLEEDLTLQDSKNDYYKQVDTVIKDQNEFDIFIQHLNKENKENYVNNKIGSRTAQTLSKSNKLFLFFNPKYKNKLPLEIGELRYEKLVKKYNRKADKLRKIKTSDFVSLSDTETLYDSKNYIKIKKRSYQIFTTLGAMLIMILLASIAFKEMLLNWESVFRFATYLGTIVWSSLMTVITSYKIAGDETMDYFARLSGMLNKYETWEGIEDGYNNNVSEGLCGNNEDLHSDEC